MRSGRFLTLGANKPSKSSGLRGRRLNSPSLGEGSALRLAVPGTAPATMEVVPLHVRPDAGPLLLLSRPLGRLGAAPLPVSAFRGPSPRLLTRGK